jgi:DNA-binding transcriptional ArsR family regulator
VIAHIGNIPVEEWLPFLAPLLALYVYGRWWSKRRRASLQRLPGPTVPLDAGTIERIRARWNAAGHSEVRREQLEILYPPGPDGVTVSELALRIGADAASVRRRLDDLAELGYVEFDPDDGDDGAKAWLTADGLGLERVTEDALLASFGDARGERGR